MTDWTHGCRRCGHSVGNERGNNGVVPSGFRGCIGTIRKSDAIDSHGDVLQSIDISGPVGERSWREGEDVTSADGAGGTVISDRDYTTALGRGWSGDLRGDLISRSLDVSSAGDSKGLRTKRRTGQIWTGRIERYVEGLRGKTKPKWWRPPLANQRDTSRSHMVPGRCWYLRTNRLAPTDPRSWHHWYLPPDTPHRTLSVRE